VTGVQTCALPIFPKPQNPKTPYRILIESIPSFSPSFNSLWDVWFDINFCIRSSHFPQVQFKHLLPRVFIGLKADWFDSFDSRKDTARYEVIAIGLSAFNGCFSVVPAYCGLICIAEQEVKVLND